MFEIPTNTAKEVRPEVVDLVCRAFYAKREMYWCDEAVREDGSFCASCGRTDGAKAYLISISEREEAFERFHEKGYHVFYQEWHSPRGDRLYRYELHETTRAGARNGHYIY